MLAGATPSGAQSAVPSSVSVLSPRLHTLVQSDAKTETRQAGVTGLPVSGPGSLGHDEESRLYVDLWATSLSAVQAATAVAGVELIATGTDGLSATVAVPASSLAALAAVGGLRSVKEDLQPTVGQVRSQSSAAPASCPTGTFDGGNTQLRVALARSTYSVDGTGVPVGVISDSFGAKGAGSNDIASGDLPGAGNPCGDTTAVKVLFDGPGTDEGRAMLQIVHDLAPKSPLLFATAGVSMADLANHIRALAAAGAKVIVDDVTFADEPAYQDGPIATAINEVTAQGVTYFSSAANSNQVIAGKSVGSYETQAFRPTACPAAVASGHTACHDFDPGAATSNFDRITTVGGDGRADFTASWNEPMYGVTTDLDFYLLDDTSGAVVAQANSNNVRSGEAADALFFTDSGTANRNLRLVVARKGSVGTPRFKFIFADPDLAAVQFDTDTGGDVFGPSIYGHSKTLVSAGVAATPLSNSTKIEPYSSRGPVTFCWAPQVGTAVSAALPSCRSATVDFAATDGAATTVSGLLQFYGTSAAAPHAAAVAALMIQKQPCTPPAELLSVLATTAHPIAGYGPNDQGGGLVDAVDAIGGLAACSATTGPSAPGTPTITAAGPTSVTVSWTAPATSGSAAITGYRLQLLGQSGNVISTAEYGTATTANVAVGQAGVYRVRVLAHAALDSVYSAASNQFIPPFTSDSAFSQQQFADFAGRAPTPAEVQDWTGRLQAGTTDQAALIVAASNFTTWGPSLDPLTRLYKAYFNRNPDAGGLAYWLGRTRGGLSIQAVSEVFASSNEFTSSPYASLGTADFVKLVYQNVLGRVADLGGLFFWTHALDTKSFTRGAVMAGFSESAEYQHIMAGIVNTVDVYFAMVHRIPTAIELWFLANTAAASKAPLINAVLVSTEYDSLH